MAHNTFAAALGAAAALLAGPAAAQLPASAAAPAPQIQIRSSATGYGQYGCIQRATNRLYALGATGVTPVTSGVWATLGSTSALIWCRGTEALTIAAGPDALNAAEQIKEAF